MKRTVFFISDGTGITATNLGRSLLTQFENITFEETTIPYVNNLTKAECVFKQIQQAADKDGKKPIIFATFVNLEIHKYLINAPGLFMDFFRTFIGPLEQELGVSSSHTVGRTHGLKNYDEYMTRINAVNYALTNDDGANIHDYNQADIILIGVSRCGKTPTCLYMALQFGLYTANYPLTKEDLENLTLPKFLKAEKQKIFGLTIDPFRLHQIRQERRPNSEYASLKTCQREVAEAEALFKQENINFLATTTRSIEEISAEILGLTGIKRRLT